MGRRSVAPAPAATVSVYSDMAHLLSMGELAESAGKEFRVAWRPVWCAGYDTDENGVRHFHHMTGRSCNCRPGPQMAALWAGADEIALMGGRGGGKSEATFGFILKGNFDNTGKPADVTYINDPHYTFLVLRRTAADLDEWFRRFKQIAEPMGAKFTENPMRCRFGSGAEGYFGHMADDSYMKYQGKQFIRIVVEEASHIPEQIFVDLTLNNRSKYAHLRPQIMLTANPNGPGLHWLNARFRFPHGGSDPWPEGKQYNCPITGKTRIWIHSTADDNPYFMQGNQAYIKTLEQLKLRSESEYRRMRWGDFDSVEGQFLGAFRTKRRESEPENAVHVIEPTNLAPWWPRAIGLDWGYSHPAGAVFGCWTPKGQLVLYREMKVSKMTPREVGAELARKAFPDLQGLPSKHMMVYLSHDAFHRESGPTSEADQIAAGIAEVLGSDAAFVYAPTEDEKTLAPEEAWDSVKRRQSGVSQKTVLTLVPAGGGHKRRMGYNLMRDYLRWTPLVEKQFDMEYAEALMQREGALAYAKYHQACEAAKNEALPVLQIFNTLPCLIREMTALQENPKNTEEPLKQDGDDVADAACYLLGNFRRTESETPRDVQIQMKMDAMHPSLSGQARVMAARHWESQLAATGSGAFNLPRVAGPTRRHWMAGRVN